MKPTANKATATATTASPGRIAAPGKRDPGWHRRPLVEGSALVQPGPLPVQSIAWARPQTGCVRNAEKPLATGLPSASAARSSSAISRDSRTSCRKSARNAAVSYAPAVRPATGASVLRSRSSARRAEASCARRSSSAYRSASRASRRAGLRLDLREADHRDGVVMRHVTVVELPEEVGHLLGAADLRVVVLDLSWRQVGERLHLDLVDHGLEDLLAGAVARTGEDLHDHALLVLAGLVSEPDSGRLTPRAKLVGHHGRVEVEGVHGCGQISEGARIIRPRLRCRRGRRRTCVGHTVPERRTARAFSAISRSPP